MVRPRARSVVPLALLGLCACRPHAEVQRPKVALVMKSLANEFFQTMEAAARNHHETHRDRYDLITNGIKDEQDIGKQIDLVEQMVARGAQALVLAPADSQALIAAVRRAIAAGVVVINIDNRLDSEILASRGLRVPFVGPSNREGARLAGAELAETLGPGAQVAIIEGLPTAQNARQRRLGFEDAIAAGKLHLVATQAANWDMAKANAITAALLTEHPNLAGVLCANDAMALGAVAAIKAAGKAGVVKVVGFDNISAARDLVAQQALLATVDQRGGDLAVYGIEHALDVLLHQARPLDKETPVSVVTAEDLR